MPSIDWTTFRLTTAAAAGLCCFSLGFLAYIKNRASPLNRSFAMFNLFLGLWNLNDIPLGFFPGTTAMIFQRLSSLWAALLLPAFVSLLQNFTNRQLSRFGRLISQTSIIAILSMIFTPWLIMDVNLEPFYREVPGPLYPFFIAYLIGWSGYGVVNITVSYRTSTGIKKNQLKHLALGFALLFLAVTLYLATVLYPAIPPVFYIPEIIYNVIIAYAIVRYQLMDIRLAFRYGTLNVLFALVLGIPFGLVVWGLTGSLAGAAVGFLGPVVGGLLLGALKGPLARVVDRLPLFKARYERLKRLEVQKQAISGAGTEEGWRDALMTGIEEVVGPCEASLLIYEKSARAYVGKGGLKGGEWARMNGESAFVKVLSRNTILIRDLLDNMLAPEDVEAARVGMEMIGAEVSIPVYGAEGGMAAVVSVGEKEGGAVMSDLDITALWGLARVGEEALREILAREELVKKERLAAIGEMASVVSHEVKTPLAVIQSSAHFLANRLGKGEDEKVLKHLGIIDAQTEALNTIVAGILDYARSRELRLERAGINGLIRDLVGTLPVGSGVEVRLSLSDGVPDMELDRTEVGQALTNLINNAIQAMPGGGRLEVGTRENGEGGVRIWVSDSGCGIPAEDLGRVFEPFYTTRGGGTGLGLAVVKKVVERHRGEVRVESEVGKGTTVTMLLPVSPSGKQ